MKRPATMLCAIMAMSVITFGLRAEEKPAAAVPAASAKTPLVNEAHPGLASGCLTYARLTDLPKGTLLRAGDVMLTEKDVATKVAESPDEVSAQLKKNGFYVLEQLAGPKLVVQAAKDEAKRTGKPLSTTVDRLILDEYFGTLIEKVQVTDAEVAEFYRENKGTLGDATLDQVKAGLRQFLERQKQQDVIAKHLETLGQRMTVEVSAAWVKEQAALAKDNVVDKARASGKPTLVDFGASGCKPCEMMVPILADLKKKHEGKANVLFVHVGEEQVLASRYGIQSIPVQVFFDKDGKEMFRHVGFFTQAEIEKKLAEIGGK